MKKILAISILGIFFTSPLLKAEVIALTCVGKDGKDSVNYTILTPPDSKTPTVLVNDKSLTSKSETGNQFISNFSINASQISYELIWEYAGGEMIGIQIPPGRSYKNVTINRTTGKLFSWGTNTGGAKVIFGDFKSFEQDCSQRKKNKF